ncbi:MAG: GNAT family N-acetyltransferase [Proteobacteria bacterium]|nr:GNAT family N-acetyltransferase [Pseudomonadota bacterium]
MTIIDLSSEHHELYFQCLEDWSSEVKEGADHKEKWYCKYADKGLRVKLARDETGTVGGMIQYLPIEESFVQGEDLYFIMCIWVHGHPEGRGNFQKRGMGRELLLAAEEDARKLGAKGMAAWGVGLPFWMKASWFKKQGYKKADRDFISLLLWKPFSHDARPPKWIRKKKKPEKEAGQVTVTAFRNGWCPAQNMIFERAKRACAELGETVVFREIDTSKPEVFLEWGIVDGLFVDGKRINNGPPPSYEKIRKLIAKRIKR